MCFFCIVPFTRGKRAVTFSGFNSEGSGRTRKEGVKEVTLLGQNVNSYNNASRIKNNMNQDQIDFAKAFPACAR